MELKDWGILASMFGTATAFAMSLYNLITARREKAAALRKEAAAKARPLSISLRLERSPVGVIPRIADPAKPYRVEAVLRLRVVNLSGRPLSIERPYLELPDRNNSRIDLDSAETFPLRLDEAGPVSLAMPLWELFDAAEGPQIVTVVPVCRIVDGVEVEGEPRSFSRKPVERPPVRGGKPAQGGVSPRPPRLP